MPLPINSTQTYQNIMQKYSDMKNPVARILVGNEEFCNEKSDIIVGAVYVELSSGFEASIASFRLYDVYDRNGHFRYEKIKKQVMMGNSVKISLGYLDRVEPVFIGFISGVNFGYQEGDLPYIEVSAMDVKGLMMGGSYANQLTATTYSAAVKEVLNRTGEGVLQQMGGITEIAVTNTPDAGGNPAKLSPEPGTTVTPAPPLPPQPQGQPKSSPITVEMVSESDYEFVVRAAKRYNFEFFVDRGKVLFRPAKSDPSLLMELGVGKGLIHFDIGYSITGIVGEVQARAMDPGTGKVISHSAKFNNKISTASKAKELVGKGAKVYLDASISSKEDAEARVVSLMERMSYRLGSLEADCVGIPELVPGRFIGITGLGSPVDNKFYITKVTHAFTGEEGFTTRIEGCAAKIESQ